MAFRINSYNVSNPGTVREPGNAGTNPSRYMKPSELQKLVLEAYPKATDVAVHGEDEVRFTLQAAWDPRPIEYVASVLGGVPTVATNGEVRVGTDRAQNIKECLEGLLRQK
jgi:hypothetical protein